MRITRSYDVHRERGFLTQGLARDFPSQRGGFIPCGMFVFHPSQEFLSKDSMEDLVSILNKVRGPKRRVNALASIVVRPFHPSCAENRLGITDP